MSNNLLSLESYRKIASITDAWSFWGFTCSLCGACGKCDDCKRVWLQERGHDGLIARDDLITAICLAEDYTRNLNQIPLGKQWLSETVDLSRVPAVGRDCRWPAVQLCNNYLIELGKPVYELIDIATVSYTDKGGNPAFPDRPFSFEVSTNIAGIDPNEVQVHFIERLDDCPPSNQSWIRPVKASYNDPDLSIKGRAWLMGDPSHWWDNQQCPLDCTSPSSFVNEVEIYRVYSDPTQAVTFLTDDRPCQCAVCCGDHVSEQAGIGGVANGRTGLAWLGWQDCCPKCAHADKAIVHYKAGVESKQACAFGWDKITSMLATGLLPEVCMSCCDGESSRFFHYWMQDLSEQSDSESILGRRFSAPLEQLQNPYNRYTRGVVEAWGQVQRLKVGRALTFG